MLPLVQPHLVDRYDSGVIELGRRFGFGVKPLDVRRRGQLAAEDHLDRHNSVQRHPPGFEDDPHAPAGDLFQNFVIAKVANPFGGRDCGVSLRRFAQRRGQALHAIVIGKEFPQFIRQIRMPGQHLVAAWRIAILDRAQIRRDDFVELVRLSV